MNKLKLNIGLLAAVLIIVTACDPQVVSGPDLPATPISADVTFEIEHDTDNPNLVHFTSTAEGFKFLWDLGNGQKAQGTTVTGAYPLAGEYTVSLTAFTKSGQAMNTGTVTIAQDNALMLDDPDLNMITGGAGQIGGKTWVIDSTQIAHMGVGPPGGYTPEWWQAAPGDKSGTGLYNDEYTFDLDGLSFTMETNGDVFLNGAHEADFPGAVDAPGGDKMADWTAPGGLSFSFNKAEDGTMTLGVSDPGFIGFYTGVHEYQILELEENLMALRFEDTINDVIWYHRLIPKGYEHPVEALPYTSEELTDNFDVDGNVAWMTDQIADFTEGYDNPAPVGINTSSKVAKYEKGSGKFDNAYIDLGFELNLNERPIVRLKAYLPSYNDYTTEDPNKEPWSTGILEQQVQVKLHNVGGATGLGGNAWQTQATVTQPVNQTDTWVELEFDFSSVSDRDDFDRIVIQIGGEGHGMPGIFFIDDFQLTQ